jgi:hypothetical protein
MSAKEIGEGGGGGGKCECVVREGEKRKMSKAKRAN